MICEDCGLPIEVCSALLLYEKAVKQFRLGNTERAEKFAAGAKEDHNLYLERPLAAGQRSANGEKT